MARSPLPSSQFQHFRGGGWAIITPINRHSPRLLHLSIPEQLTLHEKHALVLHTVQRDPPEFFLFLVTIAIRMSVRIVNPEEKEEREDHGFPR